MNSPNSAVEQTCAKKAAQAARFYIRYLVHNTFTIYYHSGNLKEHPLIIANKFGKRLTNLSNIFLIACGI